MSLCFFCFFWDFKRHLLYVFPCFKKQALFHVLVPNGFVPKWEVFYCGVDVRVRRPGDTCLFGSRLRTLSIDISLGLFTHWKLQMIVSLTFFWDSWFGRFFLLNELLIRNSIHYLCKIEGCCFPSWFALCCSLQLKKKKKDLFPPEISFLDLKISLRWIFQVVSGYYLHKCVQHLTGKNCVCIVAFLWMYCLLYTPPDLHLLRSTVVSTVLIQAQHSLVLLPSWLALKTRCCSDA